MRPLLTFAAVLLLAGCDSSGPDRADLQADDVRIALGETETVDGLAITFDAVLMDSRCPADVVCVWAGIARVTLTLEGEGYDLTVVDRQHAEENGVRVGNAVVSPVGLDAASETQRPVVTVSVADA